MSGTSRSLARSMAFSTMTLARVSSRMVDALLDEGGLVLVDGFRLCQIQIRLELPGAGFITLQSQPEQAFVVHGQVGIARVQLLPFHQMGERKYEFLNRPYELTGVKALHPEDLTDYRKIFLDHGIDCFF